MGQPLNPWQQFVADVGCEYDPDTGIPFYREVFVTVPRQQGKTTLFVSWQLDRCLSWGKAQRSVFTAQSGKDARDKWLDEIFPLIEHSKLAPLIGQISKGMGNEAISFKTGSKIRLASTSASAGHSKTLHQAVLDEIWHDEDDRREQGLRPAMLTIPDAQLLVCSTAGTAASTVYNRKVQAGRRAVADDADSGMAYFEWSAPDDWDPSDDESFFGFMPSLCPDPPCRCDPAGKWRHTVTLEVIRAERAAMDDAEFRRAYGNKPTAGVDLVIPEALWQRVSQPAAKPDGRLRFGVDVAEDRASAAIVSYGSGVVELIDHKQGTGWVAKRCNELTATHGGRVALDFHGPAGVLADSIDNCDRLTGQEVVAACGAMYDAIVEATVGFRADPSFDAAVLGVVKKPVGDRFVWSRRASSNDVTPLMAATLAMTPQAETPAPFFVRGT